MFSWEMVAMINDTLVAGVLGGPICSVAMALEIKTGVLKTESRSKLITVVPQ